MTNQEFYDKMHMLICRAYHARENTPENRDMQSLVSAAMFMYIEPMINRLDEACDEKHDRGEFYTDEQMEELNAIEDMKEYSKRVKELDAMDTKQELINEIYDSLYTAYGLNKVENEPLMEKIEEVVENNVYEMVDEINQFCYEEDMDGLMIQ